MKIRLAPKIDAFRVASTVFWGKKVVAVFVVFYKILTSRNIDISTFYLLLHQMKCSVNERF